MFYAISHRTNLSHIIGSVVESLPKGTAEGSRRSTVSTKGKVAKGGSQRGHSLILE